MAQVALTSEKLSDCITFFHPNRPVLVTTRDRDGTIHVAPFAWCVPTSADPPMVTLALLTTPRKQHSLVNIERDRQFVVNFPDHDLAADMVRSSYRYPAGVRKTALVSFEYSASQCVGVPAIKQCRAHVECRLVTSLVTGDHTLLVAEVVAASGEPGQQHEDSVPDLEKHPPCLHLGHRSFPDKQVHGFVVGGKIQPLAVPFDISSDGSSTPSPVPPAATAARPTDLEPASQARRRVVASGFSCPEGPCCHGGQGDLFVADWATGYIRRVTPEGIVTDFADTGGMPSGACVGPEGLLYVCDPGRREVLAITAGGAIQVIAGGYQGSPLLGPNDCAVDAKGNLYFSDADGFHPLEPSGRIYRLRPDRTLELFAAGFAFPNGLAISAGGDYLYLAETFANRIHRFTLDEQGQARERQLFAHLHGGTGPDGLAVDEEGTLFAAHFGKGVVAVLAPTGQMLAELPTGGALPTNVVSWNGSLCVTELENGCVMQL